MALYAFDGTWNDSSIPESERNTNIDTNVHQFSVLYEGNTYYKDGVGTRYGMIGKLIGGLTGAGAQKRIEEQFEVLKKNFTSGDTIIDIVGYSRGAAIARMFTHHIDRNCEDIVIEGKPLDTPPSIRFLGLFDTVASFGVPWTENEHDFETDIPAFIENTYHAMALDETRETFGIERCLGNRDTITEVWFRGGHGDIGGNATYKGRKGEQSNRERSDLALIWMLCKARDCGLPIADDTRDSAPGSGEDAPVTSKDESISIGNAGTLSRRIHIGDLVHHSVERTELTRGIDGRLLRRINVLTRIEDEALEKQAESLNWTPPYEFMQGPDNIPFTEMAPSLAQLSLRRYPFDMPPARTWEAWLKVWEIEDPGLDAERANEFWSPSDADRALAWDIYVELQTRIAVQTLKDDEGDDATALKSIADLFNLSRDSMRQHGLECANAGTLLTAFLNQKVRGFTAKWHKQSLEEKWKDDPGAKHPKLRTALKELQPVLRTVAKALSSVSDAKL